MSKNLDSVVDSVVDGSVFKDWEDLEAQDLVLDGLRLNCLSCNRIMYLEFGKLHVKDGIW